MVGKGFLGILLAISFVLASLPSEAQGDTTRAFEKYDMVNLPPQDKNGNFTLDEDDEWTITGQGVLEGNITLYEESAVIIDEANITINGTIWVRDSTTIVIRASDLIINVPSSEPVPVARQYDDPRGFVLIEDGASLDVKDSSVYMCRHQFEQQVPDLIYPAEVFVNFGRFSFENSYLNTEGSTTTTIFNDTYRYNITRGIVQHMNCEFNITDSNLTSGIVFYVNAHGTIHNTNFRSFSMWKYTAESLVVISNSSIARTTTIAESSNAILRNCQLGSGLTVRGSAMALLVKTTIESLKLEDNATLIMDDSFLYEESSDKGANQVWDHASLTLQNASFVQQLHFHDNSSVTFVNSSMNRTILTEDAEASLSGSFIDNLSAKDNVSVWLQGSDISEYHLENDSNICNITTLAVSTTLNQQPLSILVELEDSEEEVFTSADTNEKGRAEFMLVRDIIAINKSTGEAAFSPHILHCTARASYENLYAEDGVDITGSHIEVELEFEDYDPPVIEDVQFETDPFINTNEEVLITVKVEDEGTNLKNIILRYSTDDGKTWENLILYCIEENVYENSIPGQPDGTKVRFYVQTEDKAGNTAESRYYSYTAGEGLIMINTLIIIAAVTFVIGVILLITIKSLRNKNKVKKYLRRTER
ncbi:MAG: hypothetical protein JSW28_10165 [Thermoplasmata archaeon]|nr:MAG: hypothetical protein JSW28_10165 [Thermoplasmata archaeon]